MNRKFWIIIIGAFLLIIGGSYLFAGAEGVEVGDVAPDFVLMDTTGKEIRLSELRGKPVMLNFWATWCPPCREEMPEIERFFQEKGKEVEILAVNLTSTENTVDAVSRFLSINGYTFPVVLDRDGEVAEKYLIRAIPTSFFLDAKGVIRLKHTGPMNQEMIKAAFQGMMK